MFFYCSARPNYNDNVLKYIKIKKDDLFQIDKVKRTINLISDLQLFKFIDSSEHTLYIVVFVEISACQPWH